MHVQGRFSGRIFSARFFLRATGLFSFTRSLLRPEHCPNLPRPPIAFWKQAHVFSSAYLAQIFLRPHRSSALSGTEASFSFSRTWIFFTSRAVLDSRATRAASVPPSLNFWHLPLLQLIFHSGCVASYGGLSPSASCFSTS